MVLGEAYGIPPWEVRKNITRYDIIRLNLWNESKANAKDFQDAEQRRKEMQANLTRATAQRGRPQ